MATGCAAAHHTSTILFGRINGTTHFTRNPIHETSTFGVIPLGDAPQRLQTRGLKWELQYSSANVSQKRTYLREYVFSTSNRLEDTLELQCSSTSQDCAIALGIVHQEAASLISKPALSATTNGSSSKAMGPKVGVSILIRRWCNIQQQYLYLMIERGKLRVKAFGPSQAALSIILRLPWKLPNESCRKRPTAVLQQSDSSVRLPIACLKSFKGPCTLSYCR